MLLKINCTNIRVSNFLYFIDRNGSLKLQHEEDKAKTRYNNEHKNVKIMLKSLRITPKGNIMITMFHKKFTCKEQVWRALSFNQMHQRIAQ